MDKFDVVFVLDKFDVIFVSDKFNAKSDLV